MPKTEINYNNTYFYKIVCKDIYVGHTINFNKRKYDHKKMALSESTNSVSKLYVYLFIRSNGGWGNFDMILIEECSLQNNLEARKKERYYIEQLNATLNSNLPYRDKGEVGKLWYDNNKEKVLQKISDFRNTNPEIIAERKKQYRLKNIEQIKIKQSERCDCECGKSYTLSHKSTHKQSKRHCMYLNSVETLI